MNQQRKNSASSGATINLSFGSINNRANPKTERALTRTLINSDGTASNGITDSQYSQYRSKLDTPNKSNQDFGASKLPMLKRSSTYVIDSNGSNKKNVSIVIDDNDIKLPNNTTTTTTHLNPISNVKRPQINKITSPKIFNNLNSNGYFTNSETNSELNLSQNESSGLANTFSSQQNKNQKLNNRSSSLSTVKQQKRAELKSTKTSSLNGVEIVSNNRSIDHVIRNARKTAQLNLSDFGLEQVPMNVWTINIDLGDKDHSKGDSLNMENQDGLDKWWQQVELQKLILASNKLKLIPRDIKNLPTLTYLNIYNNELESVDEAIGELTSLQYLNLSHNQLTTLPNSLCNLKHLINLNISHNKLTNLPKNLGHLDDLEELDASNNCLNQIPKSFAWLIRLRRLNLSTNSIRFLIPEMFFSSNLKLIDLSENQIEELVNEIGLLENLEQLFLRQNKLKTLLKFERCCKLKDLDISFNQIKEIDENCFDNLVSLINFNLRDNQLTILPKNIKVLQTLERLDLTNNNLSSLPYELATIESLKQILLTGNPLRSIRKDIISRGTDAVMKYLRNHLAEPLTNSTDPKAIEDNLYRPDIIKSTKVFDLSCRKLSSVTENMISFCKQSGALVFILSKNLLQDLPKEMEILNTQLHELYLSNNLFSNFPSSILGFINMSILDLRGNHLTSLPNEINKLKALRELLISDNRLTEIPWGIYELPLLENLFANNNHILLIDASKILQMKSLSTLNLQNNDINQVPPELGRATNIRSLHLEGNPFRLPRPQTLAKGTTAILEYLRGRLAEE